MRRWPRWPEVYASALRQNDFSSVREAMDNLGEATAAPLWGIFHGPELRSAADGTFTDYGEMKGSYKLP